MKSAECFRILVVDDEDSILTMFEKIFAGNYQNSNRISEIKNVESDLFSDVKTSNHTLYEYKLTYCKQGEEAVDEVRRSVEDGEPFSVVFLDMRLPPGKDGLWTAEQIRGIDPDIHIVIVTGYSDVDPAELNKKVPPANRLMYVRKPVVAQEVRQFADSLSKNWLETRKTKELIKDLRTEALMQKVDNNRKAISTLSEVSGEESNEDMERFKVERLQESLYSLKQLLNHEMEKLSEANDLISKQELELEEKKVAINVLAGKYNQNNDLDEEIKLINKRITYNILEFAEPYIRKIEEGGLKKEQEEYLSLLKKNLREVASPGMHNLANDSHKFTSSEVKVINLIMQGKTSKEIANLFNLSPRTIEYHRKNIRKKFGLSGSKHKSLKEYLHSIQFSND